MKNGKKLWLKLVIGLGGVTFIMILFPVLAGKPVKINTNRELDGVSDEISDILYYGALAPNSHNAQMWKVKINPNTQKVTIALDKKRSLKEVDPMDREAYISIGAYIKNTLLAFKAYGYKTDLNISDKEDSKIAVIHYVKREQLKPDTELLELITLRHTNKGKYSNKNIHNDDIQKIQNSNPNLHYYRSNTDEFLYLKTATMKANRKQSDNIAKREELAKWLRFSDKEAKEKMDGLPAEQLGITGLKKELYYLFTNRESAKGDTFARQGIETVKKQVSNCAGFFVMTGENERSELVKTGMQMEEMWLSAVNLKIAVQPMSQIMEESPYKEEVKDKLSVDKPVQLILRVGYVDSYGENNGVRRNLKDYIEVE